MKTVKIRSPLVIGFAILGMLMLILSGASAVLGNDYGPYLAFFGGGIIGVITLRAAIAGPFPKGDEEDNNES